MRPPRPADTSPLLEWLLYVSRLEAYATRLEDTILQQDDIIRDYQAREEDLFQRIERLERE